MHISTHHDRIWQAGCQDKEDFIIRELSISNKSVCVVDAVPDQLLNDPQNQIITDNQFSNDPLCKIINIGPEFWHIYACAINPGGNIKHNINCLMNRISGERLLLLYNLFKRDFIDDNIISFNCLYHDQNPDVDQRLKNFDQAQIDYELTNWGETYRALRNRVPILTDYDPDSAAAESYFTVVVESYNHHNTIAFSEKIFRALQTARPWALLGTPGSVSCLRNFGFDVLDDCVDHSYDKIKNIQERIDAVLDQCIKTNWNYDRYLEAAKHNQTKLLEYQYKWPLKLPQVLTQPT